MFAFGPRKKILNAYIASRPVTGGELRGDAKAKHERKAGQSEVEA